MSLKGKAREFAVAAHDRVGQKRKYSGDPYWFHCEEVAGLVESVGGDDAMIAAAFLHDTVEDTGVSLEVIEQEFGADVAQLVSDLTDVSTPSDGNRAARKALDREHTAKSSARAKTIKLADLISNSKDIAKNDKSFAKVYMKEKALLLPLMKEGNQTLYKKALQILDDYKKG